MPEQPRPETIGFIGFGAMGKRMALNLRRNGYVIAAYAPSRSSDNNKEGVSFLASAQEVVRASEIVVISLPNDKVVQRSAYGEDGFLAACRPGQLLINTSTISPQTAQHLAEAGRAQGVAVLDAPVSGSTPEAEAGELTVLVGGDAADVARAQPIFDIIGRKTVHVGPSGMGATMKLAVNGIMGQAYAGISEAIGYGLAAGLDRATLFDTLEGLAVISPHHQRKLGLAADRHFSPQFPVKLMHKDLSLLLADAGRLGMPMGSIAAATQLFAAARTQHDADDYACVVGMLEDFAGSRPKD